MKQRLLFNLSLISLTLSTILFILSRHFLPTQTQCLHHMYTYSPALEAIRSSWKNFADFFYPPSILRGPSTPEREAAWDEYTYR